MMKKEKLYDKVRCSKFREDHIFDDFSQLKQFIEINRCPLCHPEAYQEAVRQRQSRKEAKARGTSLQKAPADKSTEYSTLQGRCRTKGCGSWTCLTHMSRHHKHNHLVGDTASNDISPTTFNLQRVPRNCVVSDRTFIEQSDTFPVGRLVMGFENVGLYSSHQRQPQTYIGQLDDKVVRQRHIHAYLDMLRRLLHDTHFVNDLLEYKPVKDKVTQDIITKCNESVEEGVRMLANHIGGATPLLLLATGCLGTVWDRMVSIICHTSPELYSNHHNTVELIQQLNNKVVNGVPSKPQKCIQKLQIHTLGEYVTQVVDAHSGYENCQEKRLFTKLAKDVAKWCLDQESQEMMEATYSLLGSGGGHHVKLIYCWQNNVEYAAMKRYRSKNVILTSSSGFQVAIPSLPRSDVVMKDKKQRLVGMDSSNQIRSMVKCENGEYYIYYLDQKIDIRSLALGFDYTYVGDIIYRRGVDGHTYRFRYFDSRILLLCRLYKLWNLNIINNELDGDHTLELSEWHDDSRIEKAGRLDFSIQMRLYPQSLFRPDLTDKQKSHIKKIMVVLYTWNFGNINSMNLLCEIAAEDRVDRGGDFSWVNPSNSRQRIFFVTTRSLSDNKDANLESGKVSAGGTGHLRCKQCNANVQEEAARFSNQISHITFQTLLDRIQRTHLEEQNNPFGLVRPCCHFHGHFTSRHRYECNYPSLHSVLNYVTENRILSHMNRTDYDQYDKALKWYQIDNLELRDVTFCDRELKCSVQEKDGVPEQITINLSEQTRWIQSLRRSCDCSASVCYHVLAPLIYLHYNRKNRTLKDFELDNVKRWSDASHNIPGIFDRVMEWFRDETPVLDGEDKFNTCLEESRIKEEFGDYVTKNNMNHSDKKLCVLNSLKIQFGDNETEVTNYEPQALQSRGFQEALTNWWNSEENCDVEEELFDPFVLVSSTLDTTQEPNGTSSTQDSSQTSNSQQSNSQQPEQRPSLNSSGSPQEDIDKSSTITIEIDNAKWILVCLSLITAMSVLSYKLWSQDKKRFAFIYHWASFLFTKLVYHRWGKSFTNSNYIHDNFRHMPDLFEIEPFVDCSTDEFEEYFAEIKYAFRTSNHKKTQAEITIVIRQIAKEFLFIIHPSLKRSKSTSKISKFLESDFSLKNILIPNDVLNHLDFHECKDKKEYLVEKGYGDMMCSCKDGLLLVFTGRTTAPIYLPGCSMLCDKKERENRVAKLYCDCQERKAVVSCPFRRCCNCCTSANAEGLDSNNRMAICKIHKKLIETRRKASEVKDDLKASTSGAVKRKNPPGKKIAAKRPKPLTNNNSIFTTQQMERFLLQKQICETLRKHELHWIYLEKFCLQRKERLDTCQQMRFQRQGIPLFTNEQLVRLHEQERVFNYIFEDSLRYALISRHQQQIDQLGCI